MTSSRRALKGAKWTAAGLFVLSVAGLVGASLIGNSWSQWIPCWVMTLVPALGAAVFPYIDRCCVEPGHCRCGYDLTGNVSGRCPECGNTVAK